MRLKCNMKAYKRLRVNLYCEEHLIRATNVTDVSAGHLSAVAVLHLRVTFDKTRQNLPSTNNVSEAAKIKVTHTHTHIYTYIQGVSRL